MVPVWLIGLLLAVALSAMNSKARSRGDGRHATFVLVIVTIALAVALFAATKPGLIPDHAS